MCSNLLKEKNVKGKMKQKRIQWAKFRILLRRIKTDELWLNFSRRTFFKLLSFHAYFRSHYIQSGDQNREAVGW